MNQYLSEILNQPEGLRQTLSNFDRQSAFELALRVKGGEYDRIVITGMGASYFGAYPAWLQLVQAGIPTWWIETSELIHYAENLITPRTLLWVISQSGNSAEIQALLGRRTREEPAFILATTNNSDSILSRQANLTLLLYANNEKSVSTGTYVNTLVVTQLTSNCLLGLDLIPAVRDFSFTIQSVQDYLSDWEGNLERISRVVQDRIGSRWLILGRGPSLAAAFSAGLFIKEAAKVNVEGMSSGQFRHGPLELSSPELSAIILSGSNTTEALNRRLAVEMQSYGAHVIWCSPTNDPELETLVTPKAMGVGVPIGEIIPLQLLNFHLAKLNGVEPGVFLHAGKVTLTQ